MIREGSPDVTLAYLSRNRHMLAISSFSDVQTQGRNIRHYSNYLNERTEAFKETKCDYVRGANGRLEKLTVEKGLLRETESVQHQIKSLLKCDVLDNEPENEITITVFRMLVWDLLSLFHAMNTGLINILGHFFEMSKIDAERALNIYRDFIKQTDHVVQYLSVARQYEIKTKVVVPKLKHAPVNLGRQLEDYLRDPEFEANRFQYLKEQEAKISRNTRDKKLSSRNEFQPRPHTSAGFTNNKTLAPVKGPDPDLIDFFESIEQNQQPLMTQSGFKQGTVNTNNAAHFEVHENQLFLPNGIVPQQTAFRDSNQFPQIFNNNISSQQTSQPNFITSNTNVYSLQVPFQSNAVTPISQNRISTSYSPPISKQYTGLSLPDTTQTTNPFRQSIKPANLQTPSGIPQTSISPISPSSTRLSTNPFAMSYNIPSHPFSPPPDQNFQSFQQIQHPPAPSISPIASGTNPFANSAASKAINSGYLQQAITGKLQPSANTNPFRQTTAGLDWECKQQSIGGGLDNMETIPVFPRPMQQQAWPY
ncbi:putative enth domain-containing protein [Erysiphe neolycopersici]|uniref:Putative enth domain-containing protein n=1 Tax=Erysiphe neolycopersici TaxID=212602 RepID=A0A420I3V2_9PEZI|nr:putative enth domain-containing protein [Erysiphe neolycopersici]